jgi:4-hydroxy-2-oxoheptanedioate aldolase
MRANRLRQIWASNRAAVGGWLTVPSSVSAEVFARSGFDWICVDMQHGLIDYQVGVTMLQAISVADSVPVVRVPWNEPGIIMKSLDAGAAGVIVPMVNSRAEAEAAVAACRYAPQGMRSYGPARASLVGGRDYFATANDTVLCICMIETREAVENVNEILSVPGVDVAYIGPSDLAVSLGLQPGSDNAAPEFGEALDMVLTACRRHGVVPGMHGGLPEVALKRIEQGFRFVEMCDDMGLLARGAAQALGEVRKSGGAAPETAV